MAVFTLVIGAVSLFVGGFASWYAIWHHRLESSFERIPASDGRAVHVLREGVMLGGDSR